jgi:hypothetical protein
MGPKCGPKLSSPGWWFQFVEWDYYPIWRKRNKSLENHDTNQIFIRFHYIPPLNGDSIPAIFLGLLPTPQITAANLFLVHKLSIYWWLNQSSPPASAVARGPPAEEQTANLPLKPRLEKNKKWKTKRLNRFDYIIIYISRKISRFCWLNRHVFSQHPPDSVHGWVGTSKYVKVLIDNENHQKAMNWRYQRPSSFRTSSAGTGRPSHKPTLTPASCEIDTADRISPLKAQRTVMDTASASSALRLGMALDTSDKAQDLLPKHGEYRIMSSWWI